MSERAYRPHQVKKWNDMCVLAESYFHEHGHLDVPHREMREGMRLGRWICTQRTEYNRELHGVLSYERICRLEAIGMIWDRAAVNRERMLEELIAYAEEHGDIRVPQGYVTERGIRLGIWLNSLRVKRRRGKLDAVTEARLDGQGMIWDPERLRRGTWEEYYSSWCRYMDSHGDALPSLSYVDERGRCLRTWIYNQRKCLRNGSMSADRAPRFNALLDRIRVAVEKREALRPKVQPKPVKQKRLRDPKTVKPPMPPREDPWERHFRELEQHCLLNGHMDNVNKELRTWLCAQRYAYKGGRGSISEERIKRLEALGMVWDVNEARWLEMFQYARAHYLKHGSLELPVGHVTEDGAHLGAWLARQRTGYRNIQRQNRRTRTPTITERRIALLESIGMRWDVSERYAHTSFEEKALLYYLAPVCEGARKMYRHESLGVELDIYLPTLNTAIEYDGVVWHSGKERSDEKKGEICRRHGVRLIRIREHGLEPIRACDLCICLPAAGDAYLDRAIEKVFDILGITPPSVDVRRDHPLIFKHFDEYISLRHERIFSTLLKLREEGRELKGRVTVGDREIDIEQWIYSQRSAYRRGELPELRRRELEMLGLSVDPFGQRWMEMLDRAREYYSGRAAICDHQLSAWLHSQRRAYREGRLGRDKAELLESAGIEWEPRESPAARYRRALAEYYSEHGNIDIPVSANIDGLPVGGWLADKRGEYRRGKLRTEDEVFLSSLGMCWEKAEEAWEYGFSRAEEYYRLTGDLCIPVEHITEDGFHLGEWISYNRKRAAEGKLSETRHARLDGLGMIWNTHEARWHRAYGIAKAYYEAHGDLDVPMDYVKDGVRLYSWLATQRKARRGDPNYQFTKERERLLDAIGMIWNKKCHPSHDSGDK